MNWVHRIVTGVSLAAALAGCSSPSVDVVWTVGEYDPAYDAVEYTFTVRGLSADDFEQGWTLYFSQLPQAIVNAEGSGYVVEPVMANWHRVYPADAAVPENPQEVTISYYAPEIRRYSLAPEGVVIAVGDGEPFRVRFSTVFPEPEDDGLEVYEENSRYTVTEPDRFSIIPLPKEISVGTGMILLGNGLCVSSPEDFAGESLFLKEQLASLGMAVSDSAPVTVTFKKEDGMAEEHYWIEASEDAIRIISGTASGAFYGAMTLVKILRNGDRQQLPCFSIEDWPDLGYRGAMIDIARNFTGPENMKKMLDLLSSYKVNVLQFHFCDDEAWRLEIEGLPELTAIGAFHGFGDETRYLMPSYDGCIDPKDMNSTANGYFTRDEFVDFLTYAAARHIKVIPEIESPGHGRAAIKAMEARFASTGDDTYLLSDPADTSVYLSAQNYTDDVMNVAMESLYSFMSKVIDELSSMYAEAGLKLDCIHIGGDEVARGSWIGSPICRKFMEENGMDSVSDLKAYYVGRMAEICSQRGIVFSGWQEMAMHIDSSLDASLQPHIGYIFCWNTIPEWGDDHVPYTLAERGYKVVLSNVNNTYSDMMYSDNPEEKGAYWAGRLNESMAFALQPYNIYKSMRYMLDGTPVDLDRIHLGKPELKDPSMVAGVQTQCFAETVRGFDYITTYMFPKILGVYERGWNACPAWGKMSGEAEQAAFWDDFGRFYGRVTYQEMPWWDSLGIAFHLPQPGLQYRDGKLYANSPVPQAEVRYTIDGSMPDSSSALWTGAVAVPEGSVVKAGLFWLGRHSSTTQLTVAE